MIFGAAKLARNDGHHDDDDDDDCIFTIHWPGPSSIMINSGAPQISSNQQISPHLQAAAAWYVLEVSQTMGIGLGNPDDIRPSVGKLGQETY